MVNITLRKFEVLNNKHPQKHYVNFGFHAEGGIRTLGPLREWTLNPSPLTWLDNLRNVIRD